MYLLGPVLFFTDNESVQSSLQSKVLWGLFSVGLIQVFKFIFVPKAESEDFQLNFSTLAMLFVVVNLLGIFAALFSKSLFHWETNTSIIILFILFLTQSLMTIRTSWNALLTQLTLALGVSTLVWFLYGFSGFPAESIMMMR